MTKARSATRDGGAMYSAGGRASEGKRKGQREHGERAKRRRRAREREREKRRRTRDKVARKRRDGEHAHGADEDPRRRAHGDLLGLLLGIEVEDLLAAARDPRARDEVVRVLARAVEKVVLDVAHRRVDAVLERALLRALARAACAREREERGDETSARARRWRAGELSKSLSKSSRERATTHRV